MHETETQALRLVRRFRDEWIAPAVHGPRVGARIEAWTAPGEPVPFAEAAAAVFEPFAVGQVWGRPWGTTWFRLDFDLTPFPPQVELEVLIDLGFTTSQSGFQAEGLVFDLAGGILKGLEPLNNALAVPAVRPARWQLLVEGAANPDILGDLNFRPTPLGDLDTAGDTPLYRFAHADVAVFHRQVWELDRDLWTLLGLADALDATSARRATVVQALERAVQVLDPEDVVATAPAARRVLAPVLATPAAVDAHRVVAVGHAHIDSAWLWPVRETIRKCARTFANVLDLMDTHDDFVFACSSAQQYAWMQQHYPTLFARIRDRVREGRFVPVGGMWVEADTNLPGGESMVRQLVQGQRFFREELGVEPRDVWLPDSFGYSAALPQIVAAAGSRYFLTQKPSWNDTNRLPHHTFAWEGIDGTRLLTHMPPVDTYNSDLSGPELAHAAQSFREKGRSDVSLVPFGYGDGGGGPTREMLAAAARTASLSGSPRVALGTPQSFFEQVERDYTDLPVWTGEMYLEFHRGTYTSQARTKRGNRRCEHLLHEAELWWATAAVETGAPYPHDELDTIWREVLLHQFHDILPGSSIAWVHQEAERTYARLQESLQTLVEEALGWLAGLGGASRLVNSGPFPVDGVPAHTVAASDAVTEPTTVTEDGDAVTLVNGLVTVVVASGRGVVSMVDHAARRELVPPGRALGAPELFRDVPGQWDAWDLDRSYRAMPLAVDPVQLRSARCHDDGSAVVTLSTTFGSSALTQEVVLRAGSRALELRTIVDWHEKRKLLKLAYPLDLVAQQSAGEIQFGHVERPTHANTSWDAARFEFPAHRWVRLSEGSWGVGVANDGSYGHDACAEVGPDGRRLTILRQSLLRAPTFPDPDADQGVHVFTSSVTASPSVLDAVAEGYRLNLPLRSLAAEGGWQPLVRSSSAGCVVETVKLADDRSGDVVVRLYEASGTRSGTRLRCSRGLQAAYRTDLHERALTSGSELPVEADGSVDLVMRPFELLTLRLSLPR